MSETHGKRWQIADWLKIVISIIAFLFGVHQFNIGQRDNIELEFKKQLAQQQTENFRMVLSEVGVLTSDYSSDSAYNRSRTELEKLYWGLTGIYRSDSIEAAMREFRSLLWNYRPSNNDIEYLKRIKIKADKLSFQIDLYLRKIWGISFVN